MNSDEYEAAMAAFMGLICTLQERGVLTADALIDGLERSVQTLQGAAPSGAAALLQDFAQQVAPALGVVEGRRMPRSQ
jgi:hypothetical protein